MHEGYVAAKQRPTLAGITAQAVVSGVVETRSRDTHSTDKRVKLPAPFGTFKVGEYTTGTTLNGIVRMPIIGTVAVSVDDASVVSAGALLIDGEALIAGRKARVALSGKLVIDGEVKRTSDRQSLDSYGESVIDGSANVQQKKAGALAFGKVTWPIGKFGFQNAQVPGLEPLRRSAEANTVEGDLRRLFCDLYDKLFSEKAFDANVLGAAHLGSLDLVRRSINADGLVLMQGDRESSATRYLYRAWKAGDGQGRGLHFLRTYLQVLFPNACEVNQLWQDREYPYSKALYAPKPIFAWWLYQVGEPGLKLDGTWGLGRHIEGAEETRKGRMPDTSGMVLTSRVEIALDFSVNVRSVANLMQIIRSVVPARIVPVFKFMLSAAFRVNTQFYGNLTMRKDVLQRYPWPGRVITQEPSGKWRLGTDGEHTSLPAPFGSFRLGARVGGVSSWRLKGMRMSGTLSMVKNSTINVVRKETLPPDPIPQYVDAPKPVKMTRRPRRLDGSWAPGAVNRIGRFRLDGRHTLRVRKMNESPRIGHFKIIPNRPPILLPPPQSRLSLSGNWKLGGPQNMGFEMFITKVNKD